MMPVPGLSHVRWWAIRIHRYAGIPFSLLFAAWFVSGIAMIYARGMPALSPETRLARMPSLDFSRVRLGPSEAAEAARLGGHPDRAALLTVMGRPAYRFTTRGDVTVFADTGELLFGVDPGDALSVAARFVGDSGARLEHAGVLHEADQWTLVERARLPMHRIRVNDRARTELYVSERTGEVAVLTTRGTRALAWVAAIPHWLYFTPLRLNGPLWAQTVIWLAAAGCAMALLGLFVGLLQFRPSRPFRFRRLLEYAPYRGWMRWHYVTGFVFGLFTLTWVFSGLLSMDPWGWAAEGGVDTARLERTLTGGPLELGLFPKAEPDVWAAAAGNGVKELRFLRIQGRPHYVAVGGDGRETLMSASPPGPPAGAVSPARLLDQVRGAFGDGAVVESETLTAYDHYYYPRAGAPPLPVVRFKLGDADRTWLYIDPARSRLMRRLTDRGRLDRWIYNGFHSLDFGFWYHNRPAWDIGVIVLSIGGLATSLIGMGLGFQRVGRALRRTRTP